MKLLRAAICMLAISTLAQARPVVIEEAAVFSPPPDSSWEILGGLGVAIDGDQALISGERYVADPTLPDGRHEAAFFLYQRSGATWTYVSRLGPIAAIPRFKLGGLAMKDGVAITISDRWRIWGRTGNTWSLQPVAYVAPTALNGGDIEIQGGRILVPLDRCNYDAMVLRKYGTTWMPEGELKGGFSHGCHLERQPTWLDLHGERAAVVNAEGGYPNWPTIRLYHLNLEGPGWIEHRQLPIGDRDSPATRIALAGPEDFIATGRHTVGVTQELDGFLRGIGSFTPVDFYYEPQDDMSTALERVGPGTFAIRNFSVDRGAYVYHLFRADADADRPSVTHVATLQSRSGDSLGTWLDVSGNQVIVSGRSPGGGDNAVRVFDLPASFETFAVRLHDFENAADVSLWQRSSGSAFNAVRVGNNTVYRQTNTSTNATAWLPGNVSTNQGIQAQMTVRGGVAGASRAGLVTRYIDENNHYFATLDPLGRLELKRISNGVFATLARVETGMGVVQNYWLRLESIGTVHRVFLDEKLLLEARDATFASGAPGIRTIGAAADFDNVTVSPAPFTTIYSDDFNDRALGNWNVWSGVWQPGDGVLRQTSTYRFSRISTGALTADQVVRARIRPTSFVSENNWVGLFARFATDSEYLYVSLHQRGVIALWRRINNVSHQLTTARLPVSVGTWYDVRLEVVNNVTRVYVDDQLVLMSNADPGPNFQPPYDGKGQVGLITYMATAEFDDFVAHQP